MGKMSYEEYENLITADAIVYRIRVFTPEDGFTPEDKEAILGYLESFREQYPFTSYQYVESTTSFDDKITKNAKTKWTKYEKSPRKVDEHVHILTTGNIHKSSYSYTMKVKSAIVDLLKKHDGKTRAKRESLGKKAWAINTINYNLRQADRIVTGGDFDFYKYKDYPKLYDDRKDYKE